MMVPMDNDRYPLIVKIVPIRAITTYWMFPKLLAIGIKILINL